MIKSFRLRYAKNFNSRRLFASRSDATALSGLAIESTVTQSVSEATPFASSMKATTPFSANGNAENQDMEFIKMCLQHTKARLRDQKTFEHAVQLLLTKLYNLNPLQYVLLLQFFAFCHSGVTDTGVKLDLPTSYLMTMASRITAHPEYLYIFSPFQLANLVSSFCILEYQDRRLYEAVSHRILQEPSYFSKFLPSEIAILLKGFYNSNMLNASLINLIVSRIENDPVFFETLKSSSLSLVLKCGFRAKVDCVKLVNMTIEKMTNDSHFFMSVGSKYLTTILLNISAYSASIPVLKLAAERIIQDQVFRDSFDPLDTAIILSLFAKRARGEFKAAFEAFAEKLIQNHELFLTYRPKQLCSMIYSFAKSEVVNSPLFLEKIVTLFVQNPGRLAQCDMIDICNLLYGLKVLQIENAQLSSAIRKCIKQNPLLLESLVSLRDEDLRKVMDEFCSNAQE